MTAIKELPLVGLPLALVFHIACSGASPPPTEQKEDGNKEAPKPTATTSATSDGGKSAPSTTPDGGATKDGAAVARNPPADGAGADCCFNGQYFRCPDAKACTGGTDLQCLIDCHPGEACWDECFAKLRSGGAPVGCDANAQPPPNVQCGGGE